MRGGKEERGGGKGGRCGGDNGEDRLPGWWPAATRVVADKGLGKT